MKTTGQVRDKVDLVVILGATATGKTQAAVAVAKCLQGEIISADSRQVFRGMDIGTGKDLHEYKTVPYHLIDICNPGEPFSVFNFKQLFWQSYLAIKKQERLPILCGGTGLYLSSVLLDYQMMPVEPDVALRQELAQYSHTELIERLRAEKPYLHNKSDFFSQETLMRAIEIARSEQKLAPTTKNAQSVLQSKVYGIRLMRPELRARITARLRARLASGLIEEVQRLHDRGVSFATLAAYGLEYRFVVRYLQNELTWEAMFSQLECAIHQFAKRQETWFRGMEKRGIAITWICGGDSVAESILDDLLM